MTDTGCTETETHQCFTYSNIIEHVLGTICNVVVIQKLYSTHISTLSLLTKFNINISKNLIFLNKYN